MAENDPQNGQNRQNAPQVRFALTPAIAHDSIINYTTKEGQKLYSKATAGFMGENLFDIDPVGLAMFINNANEHCMEMNFVNDMDSGIMNIPKDNTNSEFINLLTNHGEVTWEMIEDHEKSYINAANRPAQNTNEFY